MTNFSDPPYDQPWPNEGRARTEPLKRYSRPHIQLFLGDRLTGISLETAREICARTSTPGSANHLLFQYDVAYGAILMGQCEGDLAGARRGLLKTFEGNFMAPYGRDELLAAGYVTQHLAHWAFCIRLAALDPEGGAVRRRAVEALASWVEILRLCELDGRYYVAGVRNVVSEREFDTTARVSMALLAGRRLPVGRRYWDARTIAGTPANRGPFYLRHLLVNNDLTLPLPAGRLPPVGRGYHVMRSRNGVLSFITSDLSGLWATAAIGRIAGEFVLIAGKPGTIRQYPTVGWARRMFAERGEAVTAHHVGGATGWRLDGGEG